MYKKKKKLKIVSTRERETRFHLIDEKENLLDSHFCTSSGWARSDLFGERDQMFYEYLFQSKIDIEFEIIESIAKFEQLLDKQKELRGCQQYRSEYVLDLLNNTKNVPYNLLEKISPLLEDED